MNALDMVIAAFDPVRALKRSRARLQLEFVRRYEAVAKGRRTESWLTQSTSANAETLLALASLRDRSRDLVRNNPWAARAVQAIVSNTVGHGITAKIDAPTKTAAKKITQKWKDWAETSTCDADGRHDLYGLQALIDRTVTEAGECLVRRRWRKVSDGLPVPLQIQVLEPDYLDHSRNELLPNGGRIIQGVEFDPIGRRAAYWLYQDHPGDVMSTRSMSRRIDAGEIAAVFRVDRPGQVRGIPWAAPVVLTLRDLDDYEDAYLFRQKIANCFTGFIYDMDGQGGTTTAPVAESIEPGRLEFLPAGKDIKFAVPPPAGDYGLFTKDILLRIAAGFGITYQALTGDLSTVNFSSGRMGWLEFQRNIDTWRWHMLIPQACDVISKWFLESVELSQGINTDGVRFNWTPPRREMIDPKSEVPPLISAIRGGLKSLPEAHREYGMDSEEVLNEIAQTNSLIDQLKLTLDTDPRHTTSNGSAVQQDQNTQDPNITGN